MDWKRRYVASPMMPASTRTRPSRVRRATKFWVLLSLTGSVSHPRVTQARITFDWMLADWVGRLA
jgi:hypothetical protein